MPAPGGEASEIERLKALLFTPEAERLKAAEAQIQGLEAWVGDAGHLEAATAQVLVEAFRRAEIARHRELAAAVAPVVVAAIRSEIHNSRDMMVEALYPIAGRLVSAAVANAFRELLDAINQRLDSLVSTQQWRLRLRSLATGRSVAEIALSEARGANFARILLLERGSGRLLAQWRPGGDARDNPELISGMIAAISEFASTVLSERHGELRTLDLGGSQIFLRASARVILAAEVVGSPSRRDQQNLDAGFMGLVDRHDRDEPIGEADLAALARSALGATPEPRKSSGGALAVVGLVVLALLAWALSGPVHRWRKDVAIRDAFGQALAADPGLAGFPLGVGENWTDRTVAVEGLAGSNDSVDRLVAALAPAAAPLKVVPRVQIVAAEETALSARESVKRTAEGITLLQRRFDAQTSRNEAEAKAAHDEIEALKRQSASLAEAMGAIKLELDAVLRRRAAPADDLAAVNSALALTQRRLETLQASLDDPRRTLAEAAREAVIFFAERDTFADSAAATRLLDSLAATLKKAGEGFRVVGYADETGTVIGNAEVSRLRAEKVANELVARGVAADKLGRVGRGAQNPISEDVGVSRMRNRRVTFELLFPGETAR